MIWYWGRWNFPFVSGCGPIGWIINIFLAVMYFIMVFVVLTLVGMALAVLAIMLAPCWFLLLL